MDFNNTFDTELDEDASLFLGLQSLPLDQIQYQQLMGQQQQDFVISGVLLGARTEPHQGPLAAPTEEEILDADFPVQIGLTRFPTLRVAVAGAAALVPLSPGIPAQVLGRNAVTWNRSMMDQYPYYDDGPHFEFEQRRLRETRVTNAWNQIGVILRPEPGNMDSAREGENPMQTKKREDNSRNDASPIDLKHKRRLDPTHPDFDAQYATLWHAQQATIRQHNTVQKAAGLQNQRQFDIDNERPAAPPPQAPADQGDDLFDFSWHRRSPGASTMATTWPIQQGNMQSSPPDPSPSKPRATRCQACKKNKKGCDLGQTGVPCTRCRERNDLCVEGDTPANRPFTKRPRGRGSRAAAKEEQMTPSRGGEASRAEMAAMDAAPLEEGMDAIASILARAQEIQASSPLLRREEPVPRGRSASPQRDMLHSDKCDNCERYGRPCEDERPCLDCCYRNVVCNGNYLENPYRSPRTDDGPDNSGYGTFGQAFGDLGYGGGNGGNGGNCY